MGRAHVVMIPYPAQGHVIPMMELAQCLANNNVRVTFVNTESNHGRVLDALEAESLHELIDLVSISDGQQSWEDRMDFAKSVEAMSKVVPAEVEALIESVRTSPTDDDVTCIVTDVYMSWITKANERFVVKTASFVPGAAAVLASISGVEKFVEDGVVDTDGTPLNSETIKLSPTMPEMSPHHFPWVCLPDLSSRRVIFQYMIQNNQAAKLANRLICNSSAVLEPGALDFMPNCTPIGPLLASTRLGKQAGFFWPENPTCLDWLDGQPHNSVIYVAFGSFTIFETYQIHELALGLELTNRPFLWVVRNDITKDIEKTYPLGFLERVKNRGKIVGWAPQQKVLAHPAVACFVSHCGWNSTIESVSSGVPMLCWPYFTDQFLNRTYIVDHWGVGVGFESDESGVIRKEEIGKKVEKVLGDGGYKERVVKLRDETMDCVGGGLSKKNMSDFVDWIKGN